MSPRKKRVEVLPVTTVDITDEVLHAGILPHSISERDHAYKLLDSKYASRGAKGYIEEITLGDGDNQLAQEAVIDQMMGYTEDAQLTIESLYALDKAIDGVDSAEKFEIASNPDLYAQLQRAIAALTRLYETRQYVAEGVSQQTRMDTNLLDDTSSEVQKRVASAMLDVTVGEARKDLTEALRLEIGRLEFWQDQLFGHPAQPAEMIELGEPGSFDQPAVRRRYGAIAINPYLSARITSRVHSTDTTYSEK